MKLLATQPITLISFTIIIEQDVEERPVAHH